MWDNRAYVYTELRFYAQKFIIYSSLQERIQGFALGAVSTRLPAPFSFLPSNPLQFSLETGPLNQLGDLPKLKFTYYTFSPDSESEISLKIG